jgi:hypothetical protein
MSDTTHLSLSEFSLRITSALYRVTDLLDDDEPLKNTLRTHALSIFDLVTRVENARESNRRLYAIEQVLYDISVIKNTLILAGQGGYISRINFTILLSEYKRIEESISVLREPILKATTGAEQYDISDNILKDIKDRQKNNVNILFNTEVNNKNNDELKSSLRKSERSISSTISERQIRILSLLEGNGSWMSVSEIATHFGSSVSTKTLQRDLNDMLVSGKIVAEGERRWRRYSVIRKV